MKWNDGRWGCSAWFLLSLQLQRAVIEYDETTRRRSSLGERRRGLRANGFDDEVHNTWPGRGIEQVNKQTIHEKSTDARRSSPPKGSRASQKIPLHNRRQSAIWRRAAAGKRDHYTILSSKRDTRVLHNAAIEACQAWKGQPAVKRPRWMIVTVDWPVSRIRIITPNETAGIVGVTRAG